MLTMWKYFLSIRIPMYKKVVGVTKDGDCHAYSKSAKDKHCIPKYVIVYPALTPDITFWIINILQI